MISNGKLCGVVPKQFLPNRNEYYEPRWFVSGRDIKQSTISLLGQQVPFGSDLLFIVPDNKLMFGIEICEDLWAPNPPSSSLCIAGAQLILNLSASSEILGKAEYRRELIRQQSARCLCAYAYASAGPFESSTDLVFSGHCIVAENGHQLAESKRFCFESTITQADIDLQQLNHERSRNNTFAESPASNFSQVLLPKTSISQKKNSLPIGSLRPNPRLPFVPTDQLKRAVTCEEILDIQCTGLMRRMLHLPKARVVLGVSGGLDSTLALILAIEACDRLQRSRKEVLAVTMPGSGTTDRTRLNAERLISEFAATLHVISITESVQQHLQDLGHDPKKYDVTYENVQARERTQLLMDLANQQEGFVLGTGDLSEATLGWCTFNGDHMSMYHVNIGVPKTLIQYLISWYAEQKASETVRKLLKDILATPITPELLPLNVAGRQTQKTEVLIGPYELHDYFLFHTVRHGSSPKKILYLAEQAFAGTYKPSEIKHWLKVFCERFVSQQFKRSSMPDGPKVGTVALSPRGDWRMPSDMQQFNFDNIFNEK